MKKTLALCCILFYLFSLQADSYKIFVGSYTKEDEAKGIYVVELDRSSGALNLISTETSGPMPSFLAIHPNGTSLYAVNEINQFKGLTGGMISAFSIDAKTNSLTLLNRYSTMGGAPCHLNVDPTGKMIGVANYSGGSVIAYVIKENGALGACSSFHQHYGSSVHARQKSAHAHSFDFSADGKFAYVADLGLDQVFVYSVNADRGELIPQAQSNLRLPAGYGPRHIAFNPKSERLFVLNELSCMLSDFKVTQFDRFESLGHHSTLPDGYEGEKSTAEVQVHPNGHVVYASNRGHNSIAVFNIESSGQLKKIQTISVEGKTPRNFCLSPDGKWLIVAHQDSNSLRAFEVKPNGELLLTEQTLSVFKPVCLVFKN